MKKGIRKKNLLFVNKKWYFIAALFEINSKLLELQSLFCVENDFIAMLILFS